MVWAIGEASISRGKVPNTGIRVRGKLGARANYVGRWQGTGGQSRDYERLAVLEQATNALRVSLRSTAVNSGASSQTGRFVGKLWLKLTARPRDRANASDYFLDQAQSLRL